MSLLLADATDLDTWASRRDAQSLLPDLLRRLVLVTADDLLHIAFRSGEGVQLGGWDGTVQTTIGSTFVAPGYSGWEAGCDSDIKRKADDDFDKRTQDPLGLELQQTTFVFVTPRRWANKKKWVAAKAKTKVWKQVVAYDADDLATWLALAPAVHIWLSITLGKHPRTAEDLMTFWRTWSHVTRPAIGEELLVAGRTVEVDKVHDWILNQANPLAIQADTEDDAIAFLAAALRQLPEPDRERHLARSVVVHDESAWRGLASTKRPMVLVARLQDRSRAAAASSDGHHVVIPLGRDEPPVRNAIELSRPQCQAAAIALEHMGVSKEQANTLAPVARASLGALRRQLATTPAGLTPKWATPANKIDILPALFAGRWNDRSDADCAVVAALARRDYDVYRNTLASLAREQDPPVRLVGTTWMIAAKDDAWSLFHSFIDESDIEALEAAAIRAVGEVDPKFELPAEERWLAAIRGKVLCHSAMLREGLADTVNLLGSTSAIFRLGMTATGQDCANRIVRELLNRATTSQHWASLGAQLRALAEAAPDTFLDAVDVAFSLESPFIREVFVDANPLFSSSPHIDLLWALEVLAWSPEHLGRATVVLANLASVDPGGKTANRPARTLQEIFLPWHPSTAASAEQRIRVLDTIRRKRPEVAWNLLCALLPTGMGVAVPTAQPRRRDWVPAESRQTRSADYHAIVQAALDRVRSDAGTDGSRWKRLIESLNHLPEDELDRTLDALGSLDASSLTREHRLTIWASLRSFVARHREFANATWSLRAEKLVRFDELYQRFEPEDELDKISWLFNKGPQPPNCVAKGWRERAAVVAVLQVEALQVLMQAGLNAVLELAGKVDNPRTVGFALGGVSSPPVDDEQVCAQALGASNLAWSELGLGFLYGRFASRGQAWLDSIRRSASWAQWREDQKAAYFLVLPFAASTWDLIDREGTEVKNCYWMQVGVFGHGEVNAADRDLATLAFAKHGRIASAIHFLGLYSTDKQSWPHSDLALELLESIGKNEERNVTWGELSFEIGHLLDIAAGSARPHVARIAKLEWLFLRLLHDQRPPRVLHGALSEHPSLFVDVLKLIYKGRNEPSREVPTEEQLLANLAHDLLQEWKRLPGSTDNGEIDTPKLVEWITQARELAANADRLEVADQEIGRILSCAPVEADGAWPHLAVRDAVEQFASEQLDRGIKIGVYNSRGVVSRGIGEGGVQERELGDRYRQHAAALVDEWPRTARVVTRIAESYEGEARHEDVRAELEEDRLALASPLTPIGGASVDHGERGHGRSRSSPELDRLTT
ncbi:MAG: hypothetical protein ABI488_00125 [Polyangiaceae bacterium]